MFDAFNGAISDVLAHFYVRHIKPDEARWRIAGTVRGPFHARAHTLPAKFTLSDSGPGDSLLARCVIPDPCHWTPDSPSLYQVEAQLLDAAGRVIEQERFSVGLRRFGVGEKFFRLGGKGWVLRGVSGSASADDLDLWRNELAVRVVTSYDDAILTAASQQGPGIVIDFSDRDQVSADHLRQLARHACVLLVVLGEDVVLPGNIRETIPNLLLGQAIKAGSSLHPWASVAWIDADRQRNSLTELKSPAIAVRRLDFTSFSQAREACDELQGHLAPLGQFAGYVVKQDHHSG